jgi:hypothetical protein
MRKNNPEGFEVSHVSKRELQMRVISEEVLESAERGHNLEIAESMDKPTAHAVLH